MTITAATIYRVAAVQQRRDVVTVRERRDALAKQMEQAQSRYAELERQLALLGRNLDTMHGGLTELDALLIALSNGG